MNEQVRKRLAQWRLVSPRDIFPKARKKVRWEEKQLAKEKEPYGSDYVENLAFKEYPDYFKFVWDNYREAFWTWLGSWVIALSALALISTAIWYFGYSDDSVTVETLPAKVEQVKPTTEQPVDTKVIKQELITPSVPDDTIIVAPPLPKPKKVIMPKVDYDRLVEAVTIIPELNAALNKTTKALEETTGELHKTQLALKDSDNRYTELRTEHEKVVLMTKGLMLDYTALQAQHMEVKAALRASEKKYDDLIDAVFD